MNRRSFITGAAGLLVAAGAGELLVPERRCWRLDGTMMQPVWTPARPHQWISVWNWHWDQHGEMVRIVAIDGQGRNRILVERQGGGTEVIDLDRPANWAAEVG